jgi:hypothetical protein
MGIWRYGRVYLAQSWELGGCLRIDHISRRLAFPTDSKPFLGGRECSSTISERKSVPKCPKYPPG